MTRQEIVNLRDAELLVKYDGAATELRREWMRGNPGRISTVFTLGLLIAEANIRRLDIRPLSEFEQLRLFSS